MQTQMKWLWEKAKIWKVIPLGPISVFFRFGRTVRVSNNYFRKFKLGINETEGAYVPSGRSTKNGLPKPMKEIAIDNKSCSSQVAVIVGVGTLGYALAEHLANEGMDLALLARNAEKLDPLANKLKELGGQAYVYGCDATNERSFSKVMKLIEKDLGIPELVIYCTQGFGPGNCVDISVAAFEQSWRQNCLGAFIVGKESANLMLPIGKGTIVFMGSTSGIIGREGHLNLAVGKFGLRALTQVMSRELHPLGIHVGHIIIDGDILQAEPEDAEPHLDPIDICKIVSFIHNQPPSAWSQELDARPWNEKFWEHC